MRIVVVYEESEQADMAALVAKFPAVAPGVSVSAIPADKFYVRPKRKDDS